MSKRQRDCGVCSMPQCAEVSTFTTDKGWGICSECSKSVIRGVQEHPEIQANVIRLREEELLMLRDELKRLQTLNLSLLKDNTYLEQTMVLVGQALMDDTN